MSLQSRLFDLPTTKIISQIATKIDISKSGRSTDFMVNLGNGCLADCTYCYMKRNKPEGLTLYSNYLAIGKAIINHANKEPKKLPNQCDSTYWTYDLGVDEDFSLHLKYRPRWQELFDLFASSDTAKASFATKFVNKELLSYRGSNSKIRIRFSLMPQKYANLVEPYTSPILSRILAANEFIEAGYDVHFNFSPVIISTDWLEEYAHLFDLINTYISDENKSKIRCEVIFLTHNPKRHTINVKNNVIGEDLIWQPDIQETKLSEYGGNNLRYRLDVKTKGIDDFRKLYQEYISWCKIRYIF